MPKVVETQSFTNSKNIADWVKTNLQSTGSPWSLVYTAGTADASIYYFSNGLYTIAIGGARTNTTVEGTTLSSAYLYLKLVKTKNADGTETPTGQTLFSDSLSFPSSQTWLLVYTPNAVVFRCSETNKTYGFATISPATDISSAILFANHTAVQRALDGTSTGNSPALVSLTQTGTQAYTGGTTDIALLPYHMMMNGKVFPRHPDLYLPVGQSQAFLDEVTDGTNNYVIVVPNVLAVRY